VFLVENNFFIALIPFRARFSGKQSMHAADFVPIAPVLLPGKHKTAGKGDT
jgi:hypothetical protein